MQLSPVLLIGSVPLPTARDVFEFLGRNLGDLCGQYPDGETGDRINWVRWQVHVFAANPDLEFVDSRDLPGYTDTIKRPFFRLKPNVNLAAFSFKPLGYADKAIESYAELRALKDKGIIPENVKLQVAMPTPVSLLTVFVELEDRIKIEPAMEAAFKAEVDKMAANIRHDELLIQWDVCHEVIGEASGIKLHYNGDIIRNSAERVGRLVDFAPADVAVGIHLCYGDPGHKHVVNPVDTAACAAFTNAICAAAKHKVAFVHIPILKEWKSESVYEPLRKISVAVGTDIYLGLVHVTDGIEGARERMNLAKKYLPDFGVATECGFGRRDPSTLARLIELHRQAASLVG